MGQVLLRSEIRLIMSKGLVGDTQNKDSQACLRYTEMDPHVLNHLLTDGESHRT